MKSWIVQKLMPRQCFLNSLFVCFESWRRCDECVFYFMNSVLLSFSLTSKTKTQYLNFSVFFFGWHSVCIFKFDWSLKLGYWAKSKITGIFTWQNRWVVRLWFGLKFVVPTQCDKESRESNITRNSLESPIDLLLKCHQWFEHKTTAHTVEHDICDWGEHWHLMI